MSRSPVQDSLGIDFVRFSSRPCASARRVTFEFQTGKTLARFPADPGARAGGPSPGAPGRTTKSY